MLTSSQLRQVSLKMVKASDYLFQPARGLLQLLCKSLIPVFITKLHNSAPIRALLPSHWEYHFIEGTVECGPAPGVATVYPNQNYKGWHTVPSQKFIEASYGYLEEAIEDEGPFYAAWGFSQVSTSSELYV